MEAATNSVAGSHGCATISPGRGRHSEGAGHVCLVAPGPAPDGALPTNPCRVTGPYNHALHAARCVQAGQDRRVLVQFVQVKLGQTILCGRIVRPWLARGEFPMWRLEVVSLGGHLVEADVPTFKTRQCSGLDGYCRCAGEPGAASAAGAAAPAPASEVTC
jgi:hypothetical protein